MKKIALLIHDLDSEYARSLVIGVTKVCKENDATVYVLPARSKNYPHLDYDFQNYMISNFVNEKNFDGAVIATATQSQYITEEELYKIMYSYAPMPIVSIGYMIPNIPSVTVDCNSGIWNLVDHLINKHGAKRLAFFTVPGSNPEAMARTQAFKIAMADHNMKIDESIFFGCDFTYWSSYAKMKEYYDKYGKIDFDAAIAINDDMAFGIIDFCNDYNIKIPEDLIVTGFDDSKKASIVPPLLSSINQQIDEQGAYAAKLLLKIIDGEQVEMEHTVQTKPMFRQTCGCIDLHDNRIQYYDYEGNNHIDMKKTEELSSEWYYIKNQLTDITMYSMTMQSDITLRQFANRINKDIHMFRLSGYAICLYTDPFEVAKGEPLILPKSAYILGAYDNKTGFETKENADYIYFNPWEEMVPSGVLTNEPGSVIVHPLYHRSTQLGYFVFRPNDFEIFMYELLNTTLCNIIMNAIIYTKSLEEKAELTEHNRSLSLISKTDELTQILNRRGFYALAQQTISIAVDMKQSGLVIYGDMDGLKRINDNYGHDAGDRAIQTEAKLLRTTFRSSDIIGRIGGDEFAIVTVGMNATTFRKIEEKLNAACDEWNKNTKEPFKLSISLGFTEFDSTNYSLSDLVKEADKAQYEVKRAKKAARTD